MGSKERICLLLLKYVPIICAFLMLLHVVTLIIGVTLYIAELMVLTIVTIMILTWSYLFKFCLTHRLASLYTIAVLWCSYHQRFIGFGIYLEFLRIVFLYFGILLFILIAFKYVESYKKSTTKCNK